MLISSILGRENKQPSTVSIESYKYECALKATCFLLYDT